MKLTQIYIVLLVWVMVLFAKTQCQQQISAKRQSVGLAQKRKVDQLSETALVDTAIENFKKVIAEETGHLHRLSCKFKQNEDTKALQKVTRGYFTDYHKKSCCLIDKPNKSLGKMKKIAEVVFTKLDPDHLAVITWDSQRHSSVKYVPLKEDIFSVAQIV